MFKLLFGFLLTWGSSGLPRLQNKGVAFIPSISGRFSGLDGRRAVDSIRTNIGTTSFAGTSVKSRSDSEETPTPASISTSDSISLTPNFNGKIVYPRKMLITGLQGQGSKVSAVYAFLNAEFRRGTSEGWENCEYIGVTDDLKSSIQYHQEREESDKVSNIRVKSFPFGSARETMKETAMEWLELAAKSGASIESSAVEGWLLDDNIEDYEDEDDEIDMDDLEEGGYPIDFATKSQELMQDATVDSIISPFAAEKELTSTEEASESASLSPTDDSPMTIAEFTRENVDKVLDEVRPYLISDGGNVSVERVDETTGNVYLLLEGACGSCPSSTVTMQMGIERILKENFPQSLGEVIQVENDSSSRASGLTWESIDAEVKRLTPAIIAMGGKIEIVNVDSEEGLVELRFRGSNKVQHGLDLAMRDVPFVKEVKFLSS